MAGRKDLVESVPEESDDYCGYKEIVTDYAVLESFYQEPNVNHYNLLPNQYLILRDAEGEIIDVRAWTGKEYRYLKYGNFNSKWFGKVKPYDVYQKLVFDSFSNNRLTMVKGPAGSGKTALSLAFLMS